MRQGEANESRRPVVVGGSTARFSGDEAALNSARRWIKWKLIDA
jgi:hypothetical protein